MRHLSPSTDKIDPFGLQPLTEPHGPLSVKFRLMLSKYCPLYGEEVTENSNVESEGRERSPVDM